MGDGKRNVDQLPLARPLLDIEPSTWVCALTRIEPITSVHGRTLNQFSHTRPRPVCTFNNSSIKI